MNFELQPAEADADRQELVGPVIETLERHADQREARHP